MRLRSTHYWHHHHRQAATPAQKSLAALRTCNAAAEISRLSQAPQKKVPWFARFFAFLTTPFKRLGLSGWEETGCTATGAGTPVRNAQRSTDGFWTIDLHLSEMVIGEQPATLLPPNRYLRLEVEPRTRAHDRCEGTQVAPSHVIRFGGALVVDKDGPFFEVHPGDDFEIK